MVTALAIIAAALMFCASGVLLVASTAPLLSGMRDSYLGVTLGAYAALSAWIGYEAAVAILEAAALVPA